MAVPPLVQLALDLWGAIAPAPAPAPRRAGPGPRAPATSPATPGEGGPAAAPASCGPAPVRPPAAPPPLAAAGAPAGPGAVAGPGTGSGADQPGAHGMPAVLRHPQANQHIHLEGAQVAYLLRRARRRSIGFRVDGEGLSVRAPVSASLGAIEAALRAKSGWIVRKLADQADYQRRLERTRIQWGDGAVLPYLGRPLAVVLDPAHRVAARGAVRVPGGEGAPDRLYVPLAHDAAPEQVRDAVQAWLMRQARAHFTARLEHFAPQLQVRWTRLSLSSAQSRWGSARSDGSIRLNWRLMHYSPAVVDYVVAHELSHLRVMDHSPRFWSTVATVVPDYAALRQHLRDEPTPPWA